MYGSQNGINFSVKNGISNHDCIEILNINVIVKYHVLILPILCKLLYYVIMHMTSLPTFISFVSFNTCTLNIIQNNEK